MKLQPDEWAQVLRALETALDLPEPERQPWLDALALDPPGLKTTLAHLLEERRALEASDFLAGGADRALAPHPHQLGETVGPWRLLRELGSGGMATVWLAERDDGAHARKVALKLPHRTPGSHAIAERFVHERAILSSLQHPHIAQVLDAGETAGQPWLALELVAGRPITDHAAALGLSVRQRLELFLQVLQAVQHAHGQLVIHRDLKPANVWVTDDGTVKLLDFGVAKLLKPDDGSAVETALTRLTGRALTPQYASPEQVAGRPLGVASDVYSLGVLLYELLTGRLPYIVRRETAAALEEAILSADVQRPSLVVGDPRAARALRGDLDTVVMKALQAQPSQRYVSAEALANDLRRHLESQPILARPDTLLYRLRKLWGRQRLALSAAAVVTVAVLGSSGVALWQAEHARAQARRAEAVQAFLLDIFKANSGRQSDPQQARATTARELLDLGADRIQASLVDQPAARLTLLDTLSELYRDLGLDTKAAPLAREAVTLSRQESGAHSPQHLHQLARLANVLADAASNDERQQVVAQGLAVVAAMPDRPTMDRAQMHLEAASFFQSARLDEAESQSLLGLADAQALGDPSLVRRAWEVAGVTAQLRGDVVHAEERLGEAVRVGERAGLPGIELLRARVQLADVQARRLNLEASEATLRAALAQTLHDNGPTHVDTLQTRLGLAFALVRTGHLREADAEYETVHQALAAAPNNFVFPFYAGAHGRLLRTLGREVEGEVLLRQGIAVRDHTRGGTRAAAELREFLVVALAGVGRTDEAAKQLHEAAAIRASNGQQPGQRATAPHAIAAHELARARGDSGAATAALAELVAGSESDPPASLGWIDGTLLRARFELEHGQTGPAHTRLQHLRDVLAQYQLTGRLRLVEAQRLTLCAAVAAQLGSPEQAGLWFELAWEQYAAELGSQAPLLRDWAAFERAAPAHTQGAQVDCL